MQLDTHNAYKPAVIDWSRLSPQALQRITALPIWDIAVQHARVAQAMPHAMRTSPPPEPWSASSSSLLG